MTRAQFDAEDFDKSWAELKTQFKATPIASMVALGIMVLLAWAVFFVVFRTTIFELPWSKANRVVTEAALKAGKVVAVATRDAMVCDTRNDRTAYALYSRIKFLQDKADELPCHFIYAGTRFELSLEIDGWVELVYRSDMEGGWGRASDFEFIKKQPSARS